MGCSGSKSDKYVTFGEKAARRIERDDSCEGAAKEVVKKVLASYQGTGKVIKAARATAAESPAGELEILLQNPSHYTIHVLFSLALSCWFAILVCCTDVLALKFPRGFSVIMPEASLARALRQQTFEL